MSKQLEGSAVSYEIDIAEGPVASDPQDTASSNLVGCPSPDAVLAVLSDPNARAILAAATDSSLSVDEIVDQTAMSPATAYRKVNRLVEAGLLTEKTKICPKGTNFREFTLRVGSVRISLNGNGEPEVTLFTQSRTHTKSAYPVSTDGGSPTKETEKSEKQKHFQELFEDVTGTDEITENRTTTIQSRCIDDDDEDSISKYVASVTRDDALSETISDPEE